MDLPIVVGIDDSPARLAAVEVAAHEARLRGAELRIVHAFAWPAMHPPSSPAPLGPLDGGVRGALAHLLDEAAALALTTSPGIPIALSVVPGDPSTVLEIQSQAAQLIVIGSQAKGRLAGVLTGSVAIHLASRGGCPVLVTREQPPHTGGPVVLGVEGSPASENAAEFALGEASLRRVALTALHVTEPAPSPARQHPPFGDPEPTTAPDEVEHPLWEALAKHRKGSVPVDRRVVRGTTEDVLLEASRTAQLLVVGAHGHGGLMGLLLGSVSQAVLRDAHCPVAVVRGPAARGAEG
ncbi:universal stress protein [Streptomyces wuyuanensis]|uniref:universal stress protein n=1 Tax=Streptomyces wuyuanensis TaxID=1196353 RepID=UPI003723F744